MTISFSATNPCHLYPLAREVAQLESAGTFYSGYPKWKLDAPGRLKIRTSSVRTLLTYLLLRLPHQWRPEPFHLFQWQDRNFDQWASHALEACDDIHALPGQCLNLFRAAQEKGIRTVLNHATGPVADLISIMKPEYERVGLALENFIPYNQEYLRQEEETYQLTQRHCVASTVVAEALTRHGIERDEIWVVPYGAGSEFVPPQTRIADENFKIIFAGQLALRKGLRFLLDALAQSQQKEWQLDLYGGPMRETDHLWNKLPSSIQLHGAVSRDNLAKVFQQGSVLVLPSLEEGFGLVVVQALNCGLPCIVSDRVGAKDLIQHRVNGSIFPSGNSEALAEELNWWSTHPANFNHHYSWKNSAQQLIELSCSQ